MNAFRVQVRETMALIDADAEAFKKLTNREGVTFEAWAAKHLEQRKKYEEAILRGYPAPELAAASAQKWEGALGYAFQQYAIARAFKRRAVAVARVILGKRGVKGTEYEAEARTWEQDEEERRWEAIVETFREWLYQARGIEKATPGRPAPQN